jgi:peptidoglycan/xylan/chitin deacetylase (PgdA/CDA1 family)
MKITRKRLLVGAVTVLLLVLFSTLGIILEDYVELNRPGIIVLLYHRIGPNPSHQNKYVLGIDEFRQQMNYLKREGYTTILPREIASRSPSKNEGKIIILSFDDGSLDHFTTVYPLLKRNAQKGVFFVIAGLINYPENLTSDQVRRMSEDGMEIGSHSYSHRFLDEMGYLRVYDELKASKERIDAITGRTTHSFAPPGGWYNDDVLKAARSVGYELFLSCEIGTNDISNKPFVYKRVEVLGDMSMEQFGDLLHPPKMLVYKVKQSAKFILHYTLGSRNYSRLKNGL